MVSKASSEKHGHISHSKVSRLGQKVVTSKSSLSAGVSASITLVIVLFSLRWGVLRSVLFSALNVRHLSEDAQERLLMISSGVRANRSSVRVVKECRVERVPGRSNRGRFGRHLLPKER